LINRSIWIIKLKLSKSVESRINIIITATSKNYRIIKIYLKKKKKYNFLIYFILFKQKKKNSSEPLDKYIIKSAIEFSYSNSK
jgi:hypothetical protein